MNILFLILGLVLILYGANLLTDGAASLAKRMQIPNIVIGLTIVAMGTSMPELTVSVTSALKGSADMSVGNVVGSNIFNVLLILGCTAMMRPLKMKPNTLSKEIPFSILAAVVLVFFVSDRLIDGAAQDVLSRAEGLTLISFFLIFLAYTFAIAKHGKKAEEEAEQQEHMRLMGVPRSLAYIVLGCLGLVYGGQFFIDASVNIARALGVSEATIGLTLLAGGTSLPELATSLVAARKGNQDLAIGNAVGSNLFNVFLVLGISATITPLHIVGIGMVDLAVLVLSGVALWLMGRLHRSLVIARAEGLLLAASYVGFIAYLVINK